MNANIYSGVNLPTLLDTKFNGVIIYMYYDGKRDFAPLFHDKSRIEFNCFCPHSAGVGRTGTYIALDYQLRQAEAEGMVNVPECINKLRQSRISIVQTKVNTVTVIYKNDTTNLGRTNSFFHVMIFFKKQVSCQTMVVTNVILVLTNGNNTLILN